jgi:Tfp pilus assembly protein FimT
MLKKLKNEKGSMIFEFIVIIAVVAITAVVILPLVSDAISNRIDSTADSFSGTDTIIEIE